MDKPKRRASRKKELSDQTHNHIRIGGIGTPKIPEKPKTIFNVIMQYLQGGLGHQGPGAD